MLFSIILFLEILLCPFLSDLFCRKSAQRFLLIGKSCKQGFQKKQFKNNLL